MPVTTQSTEFPVLDLPPNGTPFIPFTPLQNTTGLWRINGSTFAPCVNDDRVMVVWNERERAVTFPSSPRKGRFYIGYSPNAATFTTVPNSLTDIRTLVSSDDLGTVGYYSYIGGSVSLVDGVHYLNVTYSGDGVNNTVTYDAGFDPFPTWGSHWYRSTDNGATWEHLQKFPSYAYPGGFDIASLGSNAAGTLPGKVHVIDSGAFAGRWLLPVVTRRNKDDGQPVGWVYYSDDNGTTWTRSTTVPPDGFSPGASRLSPQITKGDGNDLLMSCMNSTRIQQLVSTDGGNTWSMYKDWSVGAGIFFGNAFTTLRLTDGANSRLYAAGYRGSLGPPVVYESLVVPSPELPFGSAGDYALNRTFVMPAPPAPEKSDYTAAFSNATQASTSVGAWVINNYVLGFGIGSEGLPGVLATLFCDGVSDQSCCTIPDVGWNHLWSAESLNLETGQDVTTVPDLTGNGSPLIDASPFMNSISPGVAGPPRFISEAHNGCPAVEIVWDKTGPTSELRTLSLGDPFVPLGQAMPITFALLGAPSSQNWVSLITGGSTTEIPVVTTSVPGEWFISNADNSLACGPAFPPLQDVAYKPWLVVATYDGANSSLSVNGQTIISGCLQTGVFDSLLLGAAELWEWHSMAILYGTLNSQQLIQLNTWGALCVWNPNTEGA